MIVAADTRQAAVDSGGGFYFLSGIVRVNNLAQLFCVHPLDSGTNRLFAWLSPSRADSTVNAYATASPASSRFSLTLHVNLPTRHQTL